MIYLDNAATTRPCPAALDAMRTALEDAWGNPSALYRPGQQARKLVEDARRTVARVLHAARPAEITFTSGGTESDVQALYTGAALGAAAGKRHIISTQIEHHAVLHTLQALQAQGFTVTLLPPSAAGLITPQQLADALQPDTCLVSIMFANNEIGTVQPIAELGALCRERGVLFHTDAVQAAGHLAIDVQATNIDLLSLSGHKFHGSKGAGALYTRRGIALQNVLYGGGQERGPDELLKKELAKGKLMIGESAGAIICAPSIQYIEQMDEKPEDYSQEDDAGLDLIDFYVLPHYLTAPFKKVTEKIMTEFSDLNLCPINNRQGIVIDGEGSKVICKD